MYDEEIIIDDDEIYKVNEAFRKKVKKLDKKILELEKE